MTRCSSSTTPTGRRRSPGIMGGKRSEVHDDTTRVLIEAATWNGPNIQRTSTKLGLRSEACGRFEKACRPDRAWRPGRRHAADAQAVRRDPRAAARSTLHSGAAPHAAASRGADRAAARAGDPARRAARILAALGFAVAEAADGLDVTVPALPPRRRHARGRPRRGGRAHRGLDKLPATLPSRRGAIGVLAPEQRLRRRAEDALRRRRPRTRSSAGASPRRGRGAAAARASSAVRARNPMSEEQSVMRTTCSARCSTPRGQRPARERRRAPVRDRRVYLPGTAAAPGRDRPPDPPRRTALPDERTHVAALIAGASDRPPGATAGRRARTSSPPRASSGARARAARGARLEARR